MCFSLYKEYFNLQQRLKELKEEEVNIIKEKQSNKLTITQIDHIVNENYKQIQSNQVKQELLEKNKKLKEKLKKLKTNKTDKLLINLQKELKDSQEHLDSLTKLKEKQMTQ